ncbi:MAG: translation initiation factor [Aeromonas sp.]
MRSDPNSRLVYSTDGQVPTAQRQPTTSASPFNDDGVVRLRRESKGRKGAGVICIFGLPSEQLKPIASLLKKKCGTGGAIKDGVIEIQGDKRELIQVELEKAGFKTKLVGG